MEDLRAKAVRILQEEEEPTSETMAFVTTRAREARAEGEALIRVAEKLEQQLGDARRQITELRGVVNRAVDDVVILLRKDLEGDGDD